MDKKIQKKAEKLVKEFFKKMTIEVDFEIKQSEEENGLRLLLKTEEPQFLIGHQGKTLIDLQRLLGRLVRKLSEEPLYLDLDINGYKENKLKYLKETAIELANEVALSGQEKEFQPMSSYERRIIHMELAERGDVKTDSIGDGEDRRVVVKPV